MNSSGIKRGLAASAVAALAVAGLPFLASSASAVSGDSLTLLTAGPVRNGGTIGGLVVLQSQGLTAADMANVELVANDLTSSPNTPSQAVSIVGAPSFTATGAPGTSGIVQVYVAGTTPTDGSTLNYSIYVDDDADAGIGVDPAEARVAVTATTTGAPKSVEVTPESQSVTADVYSAAYNGTLKDAAGRTTQLSGAEVATIAADPTTQLSVRAEPASPTAPVFVPETNPGDDAVQSAGEIPLGTFAFKAKDSSTAAVTRDIPVTLSGGAASGTKTVKLQVLASATSITPAQVDIVTGADEWSQPGDGTFPGTTEVRVDQNVVRFDIVSPANANKNVVLQVTGAGGVKFGGQGTTTGSALLDAAGKGSITITADANTITDTGSFTVAGSGIDQTIDYARSALDTVALAADTYVSKYGGSVDVTATALDQFGLPATGSQIGIQRAGGANADASVTRKTVDATGKATFTLTDTKATAASHVTDNILVSGYVDQFAASPVFGPTDLGDIVYSADGLGGDFALSSDGTPAGGAYSPTGLYATFAPLTDAVESGGSAADGTAGDDALIGITGGTGGSAVTISVDNGAKVLPTGKNNLADGVDSLTENLSGGAGSFRVVGTKAGLVNVTVTSAGRTKTIQVTVKATGAASTARNIAVSGPAKAAANDVVTFTAVVTDAFGNPVTGVTPTYLLTGPAQVLSTSGASDATGTVTYQVQLANSAASPVSLTVQGAGAQFGASANYLTDADDDGTPTPAANAPGLTASTKSAQATIGEVVNIAALEKAVQDAQDKVDAAQDALDIANGNLTVAKAEKSVAQSNVKAAKKDLKQAKKKHKGVRAAKAALRDAQGDLKIANAKVNAAKSTVATMEQRLADAQAVLEAAEQALEDAQS